MRLLGLITGFAFGQNKIDSTNSNVIQYPYSKYETVDIIKAKTELYLLKIQNDGVKIEKNKVTDDMFDLILVIPTENKDEVIAFKIVYKFFKTHYVSGIFLPRIYNKSTNITTHINLKEKNINVSSINDVAFENWQNEIKSNF